MTLTIYPGGRHEMLNETNYAEVQADVIAWLDARFPCASKARLTPRA